MTVNKKYICNVTFRKVLSKVFVRLCLQMTLFMTVKEKNICVMHNVAFCNVISKVFVSIVVVSKSFITFVPG
jgi:hypothetical protein